MRRIWGILALVALAASACSDDSSTQPAPTTTSTTSTVPVEDPPEPATSAVPPIDSEVDPPPTTSPPEPVTDVAAVLLRGALASVEGGPVRLCRFATPSACRESIVLDGFSWDFAPVVPRSELWGEWHPERVEVEGTLRSDGSVAVNSVQLESAFTPEPAACPDRTAEYPVAGDFQGEVTRQIIEYTLTIRDELGGEITFDNARGIRIIRVIDDPARHQRALEAVAPGHTCVIQVANGRHELGLLRMRLEDLRDEWRSLGYGQVSVSVGIESNLLEIDAPAIDARIWDDIGDDRNLVWMKAQIEVLDGGHVDVLDQVEPVPLAADAERLFTGCRDLPVDPTVFDGPAADRDDGHPSNALFEQTEMPGVAFAERLGWWRAYESPDRVLYVSDDMRAVEAVVRGDVWSWGGNGSCQLGIHDALGMTVMSWEFDSLGDGAGTDLNLVVNSGGCASAEEEDLSALVDETAEEVTVTVLRRSPVQVEFDCVGFVGSVSVPLTVGLAEPLGDRLLFDGGQYPAAMIS